MLMFSVLCNLVKFQSTNLLLSDNMNAASDWSCGSLSHTQLKVLKQLLCVYPFVNRFVYIYKNAGSFSPFIEPLSQFNLSEDGLSHFNYF